MLQHMFLPVCSSGSVGGMPVGAHSVCCSPSVGAYDVVPSVWQCSDPLSQKFCYLCSVCIKLFSSSRGPNRSKLRKRMN